MTDISLGITKFNMLGNTFRQFPGAVYCTLLVYLVIVTYSNCATGVWLSSEITQSEAGHYPPTYCHITNAIFNPEKRVFSFKAADTLAIDEICPSTSDIWPVSPEEKLSVEKCDEMYDEGHVFTIYFYGSGSNYYHLHYDMMLPLYKAVHWKRDDHRKKLLFMPSVETTRLQMIDWDTPAFKDRTKYWVDTVQLMVGPYEMKPLDQSLVKAGKTLCFKNLYFGASRFDFTNSALIKEFIKFVKSEIGLNPSPKMSHEETVAIISRAHKRRILNEEELVNSVQTRLGVQAVLLRFEDMSFREQVTKMQSFTVLAGMNGAGFMNALYLSPHAVAIQLVPYKAHLNFVQYGDLIKGRGPYLEWHNTHEALHHARKGDDNNSMADTTVHVEEFVRLVERALSLARGEFTKEEL